MLLALLINFNPRSHEGSDLSAPVWDTFKTISIHAPTRGATVKAHMVSVTYRFQSTLPRGERPALIAIGVALYKFQSTLPRGERPELHKGERVLTAISIHAPTRGATLYLLVMIMMDQISIHAPTRGATSMPEIRLLTAEISIHAPTRGATTYTL